MSRAAPRSKSSPSSTAPPISPAPYVHPDPDPDPDDVCLENASRAIRKAGEELRAQGIDPKTRLPINPSQAN